MRVLLRVTWAFGLACAAVCAAWALAPIRHDDRSAQVPELPQPSARPAQPARPAIDREAFAARIWNAPPGDRATGAPQPSAAEEAGALKLQLIAIIDEGDGLLRAALYDAKADRLLIVGAGDRIRRHTVTRVAAQGVELSDGASATRLALREGTS